MVVFLFNGGGILVVLALAPACLVLAAGGGDRGRRSTRLPVAYELAWHDAAHVFHGGIVPTVAAWLV